MLRFDCMNYKLVGTYSRTLTSGKIEDVLCGEKYMSEQVEIKIIGTHTHTHTHECEAKFYEKKEIVGSNAKV